MESVDILMTPAWRCLLLSLLGTFTAFSDESYDKEILPLLEDYCFDCHADGSDRGDFVMDEYGDLAKHMTNIDHWLAIWNNVRSDIMPPPKKDQLQKDEKALILDWIEKKIFKLDPANPDPGRVTIRRLNRVEYYHAVQDLLGVEYKTWENFPADDTGYGFDTIGDVLSMSPLLLEKYLNAANVVVNEALPDGAAAVAPERVTLGETFKFKGDKIRRGDRLPFKEERTSLAEGWVPAVGPYEVTLEYAVSGATNATDQTAALELSVNGKKIAEHVVGWDQSETIQLKGNIPMRKGKNEVQVKVIPKKAPAEGQEEQYLRIQRVVFKGPLDGSFTEFPKGYRMIMVDGPPPESETDRKNYAAKIMRSFVSRAFRRPLDRGTINRLMEMVAEVDAKPNKTFEDGIKQAMTAVLASPRFLFRAEIQPNPNNKGKVVQLDEYALASRLSFFLWSSVPDDELLSLAFRKQLRKNLRPQIDRMLKDWRSKRFVENFVGQWLQARDVEGVPLVPERILGMENRHEISKIFRDSLRTHMKTETEMFFDFILKNDRPARELISARYTFLNEELADFYGVKGVKGDDFRIVDLTEHPERGGILTQGTFLMVSSNPTRTSPVKRGLYVLDNLLGTPAPPAPPGIPELEEAAHGSDEPLTMRAMMEVHRKKAICASCHQRMDPIGLGLENFDALGRFRKTENGLPIDSAGKLITGEEFSNVAQLKEILANDREDDFYRCLAEKLLTYSIGRGPEYFDTVTINKIVADAKAGDGLLKDIVISVIESAPFQMRRGG